MLLEVLGPLSLRVGEQDVPLRGQRPRDVLAVLAQRRGAAVPAEVLLELVWETRAPSLTVAAVHTVVARLRSLVDEELVQTAPTGYRLGRLVELDEDGFATRVTRGREARSAGEHSRAIDELHAALGMWRGPDAFADVSDHLVDGDRARLDELRSAAAEDLAAALLAGSDLARPGEALDVATGLIARHPLRERPYALAMRAAYRLGRQADALETYRRLRQRLHEDLGVEPSPELAALFADVLAQRDTVVRDEPGSTPRRASMTLVAAPTTPTVGRDTELTAVLDALSQGHRLITVTGPGGVGKSRLLAEVGTALARQGRASAHLDLAPVGDAGTDEVVDALARSVAAHDTGSVTLDAVVAALRPLELVLLVDEAEWAPETVAAVLGALLEGCPGVAVVVTSRVPLNVSGERRLLLTPLALAPEGAPPSDVAASPAVRLLVDRLADHAPDLQLTEADVLRVGDIARRVDGLPLALEIVAGYAASRSVAELLALTLRPLDVTATDRGRSGRHRSLRETLLWSVDRLDPPRRRVFGRLGVFAGPFDLAAAVSVVGEGAAPDVPEVVRGLVREALVQLEREGDVLRFRMLRTVRELAWESLATESERAQTMRRHRNWFARRWRGHPRSDALVEDVRRHYGDHVAALRSALDERDGETAGDLVLTLTQYWLFGSWTGPGLRWTTRAIDSGVLAPLERARVQVQRASLALAVDPALVHADASAAAPVLLAADDRHWLITAHTSRTLELYASGDRQGSVAAAADAVSIARTTTSERLADALGVQALALAAAGHVAGARAATDEALAIVSRGGSAAARISVCSNVSLALLDIGDPEGALSLLDDVAAEIPGLLGGPPDFFALNTGWAALGLGELGRAEDAFRAGLGPAVMAIRSTAEGYCGLAAALVLSGAPDGCRALAVAGELAERVGLVLTPGQEASVGAARALCGTASESAQPCSDSDVMDHLRSLTSRDT
jgi:DNA-binding SARP family transcriptional activator/predicted ATPase